MTYRRKCNNATSAIPARNPASQRLVLTGSEEVFGISSPLALPPSIHLDRCGSLSYCNTGYDVLMCRLDVGTATHDRREELRVREKEQVTGHIGTWMVEVWVPHSVGGI
ncbi:hypothetical protein DPEC_G00137490 [Dallia pectoralis]|uniref:Uncharacterized protein n=1 Tax=Dallia pectoralis TaxID=75939 RepID=A0ACC2GM79_DALPE|nr:hypothetical protein DPEC_G00137490 [Dallia pectoralis]